MNKLIRILIAAALGIAGGLPAFATVYGGQVDTTTTTLSGALTVPANGNNQQVCVASATNINVTSISQTGSYLVVDKEAMQVMTATTSTTCFNVKRGQLGTLAQGHLNARTVWVSNVANGSGDSSRPFTNGAIVARPPSGTCTASQQYSLPVIFLQANTDTPAQDAIKYYCFAGLWTDGIDQQSQGQSPYTVWTTYPTPGNVVAPTAVTDVSGKLFFSQVFVGANSTSTGGCILNGAGAGSDKIILALWDQTGHLLATTALAGDQTGSASLLQCLAWLAPITLTGPNTYFLGVQGNGTTAAQFSAYKAGGAPTKYLTGSQTGGTFGTILNIATIPTSFTADVGPYASIY